VVISRALRPAAGAAVDAATPGAPQRAQVPELDPLRLVSTARSRGRGISFSTDLDELNRLRDWIAGCPLELGATDAHLLETALYEVCANVVEHGYGEGRAGTFELWWISCREAVAAAKGDFECPSPGVFMLIDNGTSYDPNTDPADFRSPAVRRRGRGIGLTIVQNAMTRISYHPKTREGNVTVLLFDPVRPHAEEVTHG